MTTATPTPQRASRTAPDPTVDVEIVVPVHDEEACLEAAVRRLHRFLHDRFPLTAHITIADNASTDGTARIAERMADELPDVGTLRLTRKGRGRALRAAWNGSDARVLAYMDVDLSTDLGALLPLVAPLLSGHSDLAIGSRLARGSRVVRGPKRELISRAYNVLLHAVLRARFSDAQCGFKAIRADRARQLLPLVRDEEWFFDTELLILAERAGLRIHEVPVDWIDDPDSRVDIVATALADLRGIARLGRSILRGSLPLREIAPNRPVGEPGPAGVAVGRQLVRFGLVGLSTTVLYALVYLALRGAIAAQWSNGLALVATTFVNTALNRRLTFGVRGAGAARHQAQGYVVLAVALVLTSGALWLLGAVAPEGGRALEVGVLTAANVAATLVKFLLFRIWVFRVRRVDIAPEVAS